MTNSTRCALLAKQACTTLSHVVQKITPPSANNFLKLFFALFAMLALNVGNAWAETVVLDQESLTTSKQAYVTTDYTHTATDGSEWVLNGYGIITTNPRHIQLGKASKNYIKTPNCSGNITNVSITFAKACSYYIAVWDLDGTKASSTVASKPAANSTINFAITGEHKQLQIISTRTTDGTSITTSNAAAYIASITVTYETSSGGETPDPTPSKLSTPANLKEASIAETSATLSWDAVANASNYSVTINGNTETVTTNSYSATGLTAGTAYTWSVVAKGDVTNYTDSDAAQHAFTTTAATTPDPEEPGTGTSGEVTFVFDTDQGLSELGIAKPNAGAGTNLGSNVYTKAPINMTATDGGTATRVWNSSGATTLRVYKSTGSLTFSSEATINKIVFNTSITATASVGTLSGTTWTGETKEVKFTFGANATIKTIAVSYVSSGGETPEPEIPATELTNDLFAWSAATAEATMGASNTFPTLTNTLSVPVTYSSSTPATATIAADGTITLVAPGTTTISAKFAGGEVSGTTYAAKTVTYELTVLKAPATPTSTVYVKVTSTAGITDGEYLIVYETGNVAFNGALTDLDEAKNTVEVTINSNTIAGNTDIDAATFTIDATAKTLKSKSGYYIGQTSDANGLASHTTTTYEHTFSFANDGSANIVSKGAYLRYNSDANQLRFRYYKSSSYTNQKAIALYKKASSHTLTYGTCTNGSVSADVADGATVLSGTTITLSNTPSPDYKLSAYDVYKTDDAAIKVTVNGNTFVMPEYDVTISATFELAKTLTGLDITTPATQTTFWQTETFNYDGLKVTAHFDGADNEDVTDKVTVTGSTATAGTQTVTVSYNEGATTKTATYNITVKAIPNTQETAYTVAEAYDIIDKLTTAEGVFIKGIVSQVDSYNETYKSITYWISDDGTTTNQLQVYGGKGLEKADFSGKTDLSVGDQVIVVGNLKKYNSTYEFDANNYLASHTPTTKDPADLAYATTEYTANVGEEFATPELTNPYGLPITYSTSDASKATVDANTGAVTIKAAGVVTITAATTGDATHDAGSASYTITISNPAMAVATLPFTFNSGKADIENTAGMTQEGLGSDYSISNAPYSQLKFDGTGDWLVIHFDTKPDKLMYNIKNNGFEGGKFSVQESSDGEEYSTIYTYQDEFKDTPNALYTLQATSRYVKFIYTDKATGNVGLGNIKITKLDTRKEAGLAWSTTSYNTYDGDETLAPTLTNPYDLNITYSSSNEDVATIDGAGKLTLKNTGTTTITATFEGNENYKASEVSYTLSYASKWALTYTSNVEVGNNAVTINTTNYEAIKTGTSDRYGSTTVVVPVSTHTLHFHAAGWGNDEDVKLIVKNEETELGTFVLSKDDGVKDNSPYTLQGTPYLQYYSVALTNITTETEITFEASTSGGKRFVLYGVNQEGGVLPELNRIEIAGEATELTYEVGDVFNPAGLIVNAIYTLAGEEHETVAVDAEDVEWIFDPATIAAETSQVEVTATYEGKTATKTITGLTVNAQTPEITVTPTSIDWGTVNKDSEASCQVTVTLKAVENATIALSGTNPTNFSVDRTALTETGTIVVSANTSSIGTYTATITISDDAELAEAKKISIRIVVEGTDAVNGDWQLVTDASTLKAGDKIIIASVAVEDKYYTMGKQNSNNRGAVISTVSETQLTPSLGTSVLTLVDAGDGKYALQTSNGSYLSAAGTSNNNYLREDANYEENNEKWTISITNNIATIKASSNNRNWIRFNLNNGGSPLFSCYGSGQTDIALYKRVPDYTRTGLSQGAYGTICLSNNIEALFGATLYTVAGKETNSRVVFDEVSISETEAGKPYIFLAESSHIEVYYGTETATEAGKHNSLQGTFEEIAIAETNVLTDNYMVVNNIIKKCGARCGLGANRAYFIALELESLGTAPAQMPGRRRVSMGMTGENGTTDLDNITTTDTPVKVIENGQLIIIRDGMKYNVQGVRL